MRVVPLAALLGLVAVGASGCGGGHDKAAPPPRWVRQANAVCMVADPKIYAGDAAFDSMAMVVGLRREARGLERVGFFTHVPAAAFAVETAGRLLLSPNGANPGTQRRIDKLLIRARKEAARKGVHCSFAVFPLRNL